MRIGDVVKVNGFYGTYGHSGIKCVHEGMIIGFFAKSFLILETEDGSRIFTAYRSDVI
jgi:hypothetical protein